MIASRAVLCRAIVWLYGVVVQPSADGTIEDGEYDEVGLVGLHPPTEEAEE
jgi:hypothetical protein